MAKVTVDILANIAEFLKAIDQLEARMKSFGGGKGFDPFAGANFAQQGQQAADQFTKTFDENLQRWRDQNGKFTTPPAAVPAPPVTFTPNPTQATGPTFSGIANNRAELEAYLATQRQAIADMKALGQVGSEEFRLITGNIKQAETELTRMDAEAKQAAQHAQQAGQQAHSASGGHGGGFQASNFSSGNLGNIGSSIGQIGTAGLGQLSPLLTALPPQFQAAAGAVGIFFKAFDSLAELGEKFEKANNTIRVGTGATGEALKGLEEDFKATFAQTTTAGSDKVASDLADLNTKLGLVGPTLQTVTLQFAQLGELGQKASVDKVSKAFNSFGVTADESAAKLDKLFVVSQATGPSIDDISANLAKAGPTLRSFGLGFDESAALVAKLTQNGVNVQQFIGGLTKAAGTFSKQGKDLRTGMLDTFDAIKNAGSAAEATSIALKTFGARGGLGISDAVRSGKLDLQSFLDTVASSPETIGRAREATLTFGDVFKRLGNQAEVALAPLGELAAKALRGIGDAVTSTLGPIVAGIGSFLESAIDPIGRVVESLGGLKGVMLELAGFLVGGPLGAAVGFLLAKLEESNGFVSKFFVTMKALFTNIGPILSAFVNVVKESLNPADLLPGADGLDKAKAGFQKALSDLGHDVQDGVRGVDLGRSLTEAASIKEDLDKNGELQKLIASMKTAKTEAEKNSIAAQIAKDVPGAITATQQVVDESGKIHSVYKINAQAAQEFAEKQKEGFSDELKEKQKAFGDGLKNQVDQYDRNKAALVALGKEIANPANKGHVGELTEKYRELETKTNDSAKAVGETVEKGQELGVVSKEAAKIGEQFGFSAEKAESLNESVNKSNDAIKDAQKSTEELSAAFGDLLKNADSGLNAAKGAIKETLVELSQAQLDLQKAATPDEKKAVQDRIDGLKARLAEERKAANDQLADARRVHDINDKVDEEFALKKKKKAVVQAEDLSKELRKINNDTTRLARENDAQNLADQRRAAREALAAQLQDKLDALDQQQKDEFAKINKLAKDKKPIVVDGVTVDPKKAKRLISDALQNQADELQRKFDEVDLPKLLRTQFEDVAKELDTENKSLLDSQLATADAALTAITERAKRTGEATLPATKAAGEARLAQLQEENDAAIANAVRSSKAFQTASQGIFKELAAQNAALDQAVSDGTKTAEQAALERTANEAAARKKLGTIETDVLVQARLNPDSLDFSGINAAVEQGLGKENQTRTDNRQKELNADFEDRKNHILATEPDLAKAQRDIALLELDKKTKEELALTKGNEEKKLEIERAAAKERGDILNKYLRSTNESFRVFDAFRVNLERAFTRTVSDEAAKQFAARKTELDKASDENFQAVLKGAITLEDFLDKEAALRSDSAKLAADIEQSKYDFPKELQRAGIETFKTIKEQEVGVAQENSQKLIDDLAARQAREEELTVTLGDRKAAAIQASAEFEQKTAADSSAILVGTVQAAAASLIEFAIEQHHTFGEIAKEIVKTALKSLQALVPILSSTILGYSLATPESVATAGALGVAKWVALTAILEAAVVGAGALVEGLATGRIDIAGPGTTTNDKAGLFALSRSESVVTAEGTLNRGQFAAHKPMLEAINRGKLVEDWFAEQLRGGDRFIQFADTFNLPRLTAREARAIQREHITVVAGAGTHTTIVNQHISAAMGPVVAEVKGLRADVVELQELMGKEGPLAKTAGKGVQATQQVAREIREKPVPVPAGASHWRS